MTYVSRQVQVKVSEQRNGEDVLLQRGDRPVRFDGVGELAEVRAEKFSLTLPVVNQDLLAGASIAQGRVLLLETDTELTVRLNDVGDTGFVVKPVVDADRETKRGVMYLEGDFAHVYVSIAGSGTAIVMLGVLGA